MWFIIERCLCNTIIQTTWMTTAKSGPGFLLGQFWIISVYYTTRLLSTKCLNGIGSKAQHPGLPVPLKHLTCPWGCIVTLFLFSFLHTWLHCDNGKVENGSSNLTENLVSGAFIWQELWVEPSWFGSPYSSDLKSLCAMLLSPNN